MTIRAWFAPLIVALSACAATPKPDTAPATIVDAGAPGPGTERGEVVEPDPAALPEPGDVVVSLLGRSRRDPVVESFIESSGAVVEVSPYPDGTTYHVAKNRGFSLLEEGGVIGTVFLYSQGYEDHERYTGILPRGLTFDDDRHSVHGKLGKPDRHGGGPGHATPIGPVAAWDKYYLPEWSLHVQYGQNGTISLVTLMTAASDPHRR